MLWRMRHATHAVVMTLEEILEHVEESGEETLLMEPCSEYDECIIRIGARFHEEAQEWFNFNIMGGWNGPGTPIDVNESMMRTFDESVA
jgi:hypothetical protein